MEPDEFGHAVVRGPREVERDRGRAHGLDRRRGERKDLMVVVEAVHDAEPLAEVVQHGNRADALSHVLQGRAHFQE